MFRLDEKLTRIRQGAYRKGDFIIADAKDGDMGPSLTSSGPVRDESGDIIRFRTRDEFLNQIQAIVEQDIVDIMLTSVSNLQRLHERNVFTKSAVKPAIRANDTSDIWVMRGARYVKQPSRAFRSANIARLMEAVAASRGGTNLGLYSITFNNDLNADLASLEAFAEFRREALAHDFHYFLEVFNPNAPVDLDPHIMPRFVNDCILRCLAGLDDRERPEFLKIAYNGPEALEELTSFDPSVVVGVLGGGAGTARDCLESIAQAERFGARVALFGRKINLADDPLSMVEMMRAVADGALGSYEAVQHYHGVLQTKGIRPIRSFEEDSLITEKALERASH